MGFMYGVIREDMKVIGYQIRCTEREYMSGAKEGRTRGNTRMITNMGLGATDGRTGGSTLGSGEITRDMGKGS